MMWVRIFLYIIGAYTLFCSLLFIFQRSFLYFPIHEKPVLSAYGQAADGFEVVSIQTKDELRLEGWYHPAQDPQKPVLLWFHGNGGHYGQRVYQAGLYTKEGYGVLLAGYRGYGGNPGVPSEALFFDDSVRWAYLLTQVLDVPSEKIVYYGESLGSGVVVYLATQITPKALILHTPYKSIRALAERQYPIFPIRLMMKDPYDSLARIKQVHAPILMMHGTRDEIIPFGHAQSLYEAANEPKAFYVLEGAAHNNIYMFGAKGIVLNFLQTIFDKD